MDKKLEYTI